MLRCGCNGGTKGVRRRAFRTYCEQRRRFARRAWLGVTVRGQGTVGRREARPMQGRERHGWRDRAPHGWIYGVSCIGLASRL
ncbi:hypothetical protein STRNTR1_3382 [Stenotrophomonas maltophilia]|nr:hypothetical protein STRNTR1_3382 [Stenotrophomonas maltophilia]